MQSVADLLRIVRLLLVWESGILMAWWGIILTFSSAMRVRTGRGLNGHRYTTEEWTAAVVHQQMGRCVEARDLGQDTLHRRRRILGDDHPSTLRSAGNLASYQRKLGEADS